MMRPLVLVVFSVLALSLGTTDAARTRKRKTNLREETKLQLIKTGRELEDNNNNNANNYNQQGYNNANYNNNNNGQNYNDYQNWVNNYGGYENNNANANANNNGNGNYNNGNNGNAAGGNTGYWDENGNWVEYDEDEMMEYNDEYGEYNANATDYEDYDDDRAGVHYAKLLEVHDMMEFYRLCTAILGFVLFLMSLYICFLRRQVAMSKSSLSQPLAPKTPYSLPTLGSRPAKAVP